MFYISVVLDSDPLRPTWPSVSERSQDFYVAHGDGKYMKIQESHMYKDTKQILKHTKPPKRQKRVSRMVSMICSPYFPVSHFSFYDWGLS